MISEERIKEVLIPVFMRQDQASIHWPDIFEEVRAIEAEVTAPLEANIKHLEQERDALAMQYKQMREALEVINSASQSVSTFRDLQRRAHAAIRALKG